MLQDKDIDILKDVIQDTNLNFLIGSGASYPLFNTLGNIEKWLTELNTFEEITERQRNYIIASLYKNYFDVAMFENIELRSYNKSVTGYIEEGNSKIEKINNTLKNYVDFLSLINNIVYERRSNTVSKQVNLFTTNIDVLFEKSIETIGLQFNDGFHGIFNKTFSLSNFKKSYFQRSSHYDNISELPVFNLLKVHGSVTWKKRNGIIEFDNLELIEKVNKASKKINFINIDSINELIGDASIKDFLDSIKSLKDEEIPDCSSFIEEYNKLQIINPTKDKFKDTTFDKNYYEMLRLFSNELEKESTALFIIGFSLADEHIREIIIRAIKSNPTLNVYIFSYKKDASDILHNLMYDKFQIEHHRNCKIFNPYENFDLQKINEDFFKKIIDKIIENGEK